MQLTRCSATAVADSSASAKAPVPGMPRIACRFIVFLPGFRARDRTRTRGRMQLGAKLKPERDAVDGRCVAAMRSYASFPFRGMRLDYVTPRHTADGLDGRFMSSKEHLRDAVSSDSPLALRHRSGLPQTCQLFLQQRKSLLMTLTGEMCQQRTRRTPR